MMGKILERYELSDINIKIVKASTGYDVIFNTVNKTGVFLKNVELSEAYAFVSRYMYHRVKLMESETTR